MKRLLILGAALFALGMASGTATAQVRPSPIVGVGVACATTQYDLNGDGLLTKSDITLWIQQLMGAGCMDQDATGACAKFDENHDGVVTGDDVLVRARFFITCSRSPIIPNIPLP